MLAVVKTPHINVRIEGEVSPRLLRLLKTEYGQELKLLEGDEKETVDFFKTNFYKTVKKNLTPGTYVKIYRDNLSMTQEQLGAKVGVSKSFVCDVEHNRRAISKEIAKKLSKLFKISPSHLI